MEIGVLPDSLDEHRRGAVQVGLLVSGLVRGRGEHEHERHNPLGRLDRGVQCRGGAHRGAAGDELVDAELVGERDEVPAEVVPAVVVGHGSPAGQPVAARVPSDDAVSTGEARPVHDQEAVFLLHAADKTVAPEERQSLALVGHLDVDAANVRHGGQFGLS